MQTLDHELVLQFLRLQKQMQVEAALQPQVETFAQWLRKRADQVLSKVHDALLRVQADALAYYARTALDLQKQLVDQVQLDYSVPSDAVSQPAELTEQLVAQLQPRLKPLIRNVKEATRKMETISNAVAVWRFDTRNVRRKVCRLVEVGRRNLQIDGMTWKDLGSPLARMKTDRKTLYLFGTKTLYEASTLAIHGLQSIPFKTIYKCDEVFNVYGAVKLDNVSILVLLCPVWSGEEDEKAKLPPAKLVVVNEQTAETTHNLSSRILTDLDSSKSTLSRFGSQQVVIQADDCLIYVSISRLQSEAGASTNLQFEERLEEVKGLRSFACNAENKWALGVYTGEEVKILKCNHNLTYVATLCKKFETKYIDSCAVTSYPSFIITVTVNEIVTVNVFDRYGNELRQLCCCDGSGISTLSDLFLSFYSISVLEDTANNELCVFAINSGNRTFISVRFGLPSQGLSKVQVVNLNKKASYGRLGQNNRYLNEFVEPNSGLQKTLSLHKFRYKLPTVFADTESSDLLEVKENTKAFYARTKRNVILRLPKTNKFATKSDLVTEKSADKVEFEVCWYQKPVLGRASDLFNGIGCLSENLLVVLCGSDTLELVDATTMTALSSTVLPSPSIITIRDERVLFLKASCLEVVTSTQLFVATMDSSRICEVRRTNESSTDWRIVRSYRLPENYELVRFSYNSCEHHFVLISFKSRRFRVSVLNEEFVEQVAITPRSIGIGFSEERFVVESVCSQPQTFGLRRIMNSVGMCTKISNDGLNNKRRTFSFYYSRYGWLQAYYVGVIDVNYDIDAKQIKFVKFCRYNESLATVKFSENSTAIYHLVEVDTQDIIIESSSIKLDQTK